MAMLPYRGDLNLGTKTDRALRGSMVLLIYPAKYEYAHKTPDCSEYYVIDES
jgi:hypothetical protein